MWEIALIRVEPNGDTSEWASTLTISEADISVADPVALEIGKFRTRYDVTSIDWSIQSYYTTRDKIVQMTKDAILVGMCPDFDAYNIIQEYFQCNTQPWYYQLLDVDILAAGILSAHGHAIELPFNTDQWAGYLNVTPPTDEERHTALGDARWCKRFYERLMSYVAEDH
jgi:hypothetical protein